MITDVVLTFKDDEGQSHVLIIPQVLEATLEVKQSLWVECVSVSFLGPVPDKDGNYMFYYE